MSRRSVWLLALGAAAVGAGIAYLLDPVLGVVRRGATLAFLGLTPEHEANVPASETTAEAQSPVAVAVHPEGATTAVSQDAPEGTSTSPSRLRDQMAAGRQTQTILIPAPGPEGLVASPVVGSPTGETDIRADLRLPQERGLSGPFLVAFAAGLAVSALALGSWAFVTKSDSSKTSPQTAGTAVERAVALLATPSAQQIALANSKGKMILVVAPDGNAVLVLNDFRRAPAGKTYEAWVIQAAPGAAPLPAATFSGSELVVPLTKAVPAGATVAVTIETAGGVQAPTQKPSLVAQRT